MIYSEELETWFDDDSEIEEYLADNGLTSADGLKLRKGRRVHLAELFDIEDRVSEYLYERAGEECHDLMFKSEVRDSLSKAFDAWCLEHGMSWWEPLNDPYAFKRPVAEAVLQ